MKNHLRYLSILLPLTITSQAFCQLSQDTTIRKTDSLKYRIDISAKPFKNTIPLSAIIIPTTAFAYGFVKLNNNALTRLDNEAKHEFYSEHPHKQFVVDDYLQFAPGATVFALNALGIRGKNNILDQSGVYLLSNIILNSTTQSLKRITAVTRPDGTPNAFPSGHAAEAFASAEFLRQEYGDKSVWYTISGYSAAVGVGVLRMYNNRHWLSDVVAGAGLGVLSTQASYWLYPKIKRLFYKKYHTNAVVSPSYNRGTYGVSMLVTLN